jgi:hypothetical protein
VSQISTPSPTAPTPETPMNRFLDIFSRQYGPYAFGVLALLVIWFTVVAPELKAARVDTKAMGSIATMQQKTADTLERAISAQQATSHVLDKLTERIERATDRLERVGNRQQ